MSSSTICQLHKKLLVVRTASLAQILVELPLNMKHRMMSSALASQKNMAVGNFGVAAEVLESYLKVCAAKKVPESQLGKVRSTLEACKAKGRADRERVPPAECAKARAAVAAENDAAVFGGVGEDASGRFAERGVALGGCVARGGVHAV